MKNKIKVLLILLMRVFSKNNAYIKAECYLLKTNSKKAVLHFCRKQNKDPNCTRKICEVISNWLDFAPLGVIQKDIIIRILSSPMPEGSLCLYNSFQNYSKIKNAPDVFNDSIFIFGICSFATHVKIHSHFKNTDLSMSLFIFFFCKCFADCAFWFPFFLYNKFVML